MYFRHKVCCFEMFSAAMTIESIKCRTLAGTPWRSSSVGPITLADFIKEIEVFPRNSNKIRQCQIA